VVTDGVTILFPNINNHYITDLLLKSGHGYKNNETDFKWEMFMQLNPVSVPFRL
jgi:hypothetical protein